MPTLASPWSAEAIRRLRDHHVCPVCGRGPVAGYVCSRCGADYREIGSELWDASLAAAAALEARQAVLARVPRGAAASRTGVELPGGPSSSTVPVVRASLETNRDRPRSSATVQSVLAVAGAGLVAIAAIVFTFFNPDLTERGPRNAIVAATTILFLLGARVLVRRGLRFSAESVGALGAVFVALDVIALADAVPANPWLAAALGTLVAGTVIGALGVRCGIRLWVSSGLIALAFVPAMLAAGMPRPAAAWIGTALTTPQFATAEWSAAAGMSLVTAGGWLGSALAAFALIGVAGRVGVRFAASTGAGSAAAGGRVATSLRAERAILTVVQLFALAAAFVSGLLASEITWPARMLLLAAVFAATSTLALFSARHPAAALWSFIGGGSAVASAATLTLAVPALSEWTYALVLAASVGALVLVAAVAPMPRGVVRGFLTGGGVLALALIAAVPTLMSGVLVLSTMLRETTGAPALALATGLAALGAGLHLFATLRARRDTATGTRWLAHLGSWYAVLATLVLLCADGIPLVVRIALGLVLAAALALVLARQAGRPAHAEGSTPAEQPAATGPHTDAERVGHIAARLPLIVGAHLLVLASAVLSWRDDGIVVWAGIGVAAAALIVGRARPAGARFVYVGAAYAYALVMFATALRLAGTDPLPLVCLTTTAGAVVAVAATFVRAVPARSWLAILAVTAVPFAIGVLQVVAERSGWTALSTSLMFALALTLVVTRRAGLDVIVRALAAATLVPSLAVVAVCLGAQLLPMSGSPVVLPVIAALVAIVLPSTGALQSTLAERIGIRDARVARTAVEASTLVTAVIAVGLALTRDAAGLGTAFLVLVILGAGGIATGIWNDRAYGWWLAGAAFTGALWCAWGLTGVVLREAYVLPPALGAALIGALLTVRGRRGLPLYAAGLLVAAASVLAEVALTGSPARTLGLLAAAWLLVALGGVFASRGREARSEHAAAAPPELVEPAGRGRARVGMLSTTTFAVAIVAGAAGAVQGVRLGLGLDAGAPGIPLVLLCLALGVTGAAPAALAARGLATARRAPSRRAETRAALGRVLEALVTPFTRGELRVRRESTRTLPRINGTARAHIPFARADLSGRGVRRWLYAPAFAYVGIGAWTAIERDWFTIWTMWGVMLAYLVALLAISLRARRGPTTLPPVWFVFALAFTTAIVAWSPRDLRVEWFSLPLGLFLLAAGAAHLGARRPGTREADAESLSSWPAGWRGSWALLTPGILVMLSASIAATFTDPLTWRAILVIVLALVAILVGASRQLAAPFVIGIIVLPVENAFAFLVQIGRGIDAMPWWITLAVVGAVLLILAVTYERRAGEDRGVVARLRDLA